MAKWKEVEAPSGTFGNPNGGWQVVNMPNPYPLDLSSASYQSGMDDYSLSQDPDLNASGIRPVQYCVLVKPDDVEKTTKGGIILPDTKVEKDEFQRMEGTLVAASPMAFTFKDWPEDAKGLRPRVGDRVIFARYNATELTGKDGAKYWLMKDEAIVGVME